MSSNLPGVLEVHKAACLILTKTEILIEEIDAQETGLGLMAPGNGCLTRLLETLFGWSSTLQLHALYHDVFGKTYLKTKKGPGYTYVLRNCIFKGSPLFGHLKVLLSYILFEKNTERMIVNRIYFFCFLFKKFRTVRIPVRNYTEYNIQCYICTVCFALCFLFGCLSFGVLLTILCRACDNLLFSFFVFSLKFFLFIWIKSKCCFRIVYLFPSFASVRDDGFNTSHILISIYNCC